MYSPLAYTFYVFRCIPHLFVPFRRNTGRITRPNQMVSNVDICVLGVWVRKRRRRSRRMVSTYSSTSTGTPFTRVREGGQCAVRGTVQWAPLSAAPPPSFGVGDTAQIPDRSVSVYPRGLWHIAPCTLPTLHRLLRKETYPAVQVLDCP